MNNVKPKDDDLVYFTHPSGKVEEMTRAEANKLEKKTTSDGTPLESRSVAELKVIAGQQNIEGHASMTKAELIEAIEKSASSKASKGPEVDVGPLDGKTVAELKVTAADLKIEGHASMKKAELITAINKARE